MLGSSSTKTTFSPTPGASARKPAKTLRALYPWLHKALAPASPAYGASDDLRGTIAWKRIQSFCAETPPAYLAMNHSMRLAPP
jgi:hypothetical protein